MRRYSGAVLVFLRAIDLKSAVFCNFAAAQGKVKIKIDRFACRVAADQGELSAFFIRKGKHGNALVRAFCADAEKAGAHIAIDVLQSVVSLFRHVNGEACTQQTVGGPLLVVVVIIVKGIPKQRALHAVLQQAAKAAEHGE